MPKMPHKGRALTTSTCIIYCRVSSFNQASTTSVSLEAQEALSKKLAKSKGYRIKKVCKEVGSAYKSSMKSLKEILVSNKNIHIILYDVSRFCRGVANGLEMLDAALSKNNTLVFVYEKLLINAKNKESMLAKFTSLLEQSERESEKISSRIKTAQQYLRDQGKYSGGYIPYGYSVNKSANPSKNNILVKESSEQKIATFINLCRKSTISARKLNDLMKKISPQIPYIKINCYDKDQETILDTINTSLTNGEIAGLLNEYSVKKRGCRWSVASVKTATVEAGIELKLSNMLISEDYSTDFKVLQSQARNVKNETVSESGESVRSYEEDSMDSSDAFDIQVPEPVPRAQYLNYLMYEYQPQQFQPQQFQPQQFQPQQFQPQQFQPQQFQPQQFQPQQLQQFPRFGFQHHTPPTPMQPKQICTKNSRKNNLKND
jgi:DNA invertase Pin-like site-specific DNA recombinase